MYRGSPQIDSGGTPKLRGPTGEAEAFIHSLESHTGNALYVKYARTRDCSSTESQESIEIKDHKELHALYQWKVDHTPCSLSHRGAGKGEITPKTFYSSPRKSPV